MKAYIEDQENGKVKVYFKKTGKGKEAKIELGRAIKEYERYIKSHFCIHGQHGFLGFYDWLKLEAIW